MQFNSIQFIIFLSTIVMLFYTMTAKKRRWMLLIVSYVFYCFWSIPFSLLLLLCTIVNYIAAMCICATDREFRRRFCLTASVLTSLGILGLFKYADFFSWSILELTGIRPWPHLNLILPLGISFYTFQAMSYTIDVYRGSTEARKNFLDVALFISFFPQLVAGPIIRAGVLIPQLQGRQILRWDSICTGVAMVIWGMVKKVYFADTMAVIVNEAYASPERFSGLSLLVATYAFAIQIYCDFSGYTDIAIGSARLIGIDLPKNFNKPYLSLSIREFWRRWHISLSTWLRDYLYIPLGGNQRGRIRTYVNIMITMLLGGLWHGAGWNWVIWGGIQGIVMSVERMIGLGKQAPRYKFWRIVRWAITFHIICLSWVFFRARSLDSAVQVLKRITAFAPGDTAISLSPVFVMALLLLFELYDIQHRWIQTFKQSPATARWAGYAFVLIIIVTFIKAPNPEFIYFQF
jgi:D-alanyl-lipoteichoic acid acyltransferase DltB (MBOAT superfamily)